MCYNLCPFEIQNPYTSPKNPLVSFPDNSSSPFLWFLFSTLMNWVCLSTFLMFKRRHRACLLFCLAFLAHFFLLMEPCCCNCLAHSCLLLSNISLCGHSPIFLLIYMLMENWLFSVWHNYEWICVNLHETLLIIPTTYSYFFQLSRKFGIKGASTLEF